VPHRQTWDDARAGAVIDALKQRDGALLPILHALQDEFGYIDERAVAPLSRALNLSRAEVHGVITYYHDFRAKPAGRHFVKLCRAEACQSVGCEDLVRHLTDSHHLALDTTSDDGQLTIETTYCLGNCALGPALLVDGEPVGRADRALIDALVARRWFDGPLLDAETQP
jgi:formate dehydrogenase subunit gamma